MFDFAKLRIPRRHVRQLLRRNPLLRWERHTPAHGYAPLNCGWTAEWEGWTFSANDTEVKEIRGSFHCSYYGGTNWQPFTSANLHAVVNALCDALGLFGGELRIVNLEVGINLRPPLDARAIMSRMLFHGKRLPEPMEDTDRGMVFRHPGRYRLKVYDKGYQHPEAGDLYRFEVHVDRMKILERIGIRTVQDLLDPVKQEAARQFLLEQFDALFIVEPPNPFAGLRPAQRALLDNATSPAYWMALTPNKRHRRRGTVERIYRAQPSPYLKDQLRALISDETRRFIDHQPATVRGEERRTMDAEPMEGGMFDATCAQAWANTRVIRHHIGPTIFNLQTFNDEANLSRPLVDVDSISYCPAAHHPDGFRVI